MVIKKKRLNRLGQKKLYINLEMTYVKCIEIPRPGRTRRYRILVVTRYCIIIYFVSFDLLYQLLEKLKDVDFFH